MSWIAGICRFDGDPVTDDDAERMLAPMRHRPPETEGVWSDGTAALGHHGLHTTPESEHERLPLDAGGLVLVADARIDNRVALLGALSGRLRALDLVEDGRPVTDADLILAAYAEWGERCPEHLVGDFAFAVWDGRRRSLFCARDPFGVRPLYVHDGTGGGAGWVAVASEPRGLFAAGVSDAVDEDYMADRVASGTEWSPDQTPFPAVRLLPNGHAMVASSDGVREWQHYTLRPSAAPVPETNEAVAERFAELFREAVRCRIRGGRRVGAQLSGGLDSTAVACVARDALAGWGTGPLDTFSLAFETLPRVDERAFVDAVVEAGGVRSHLVYGDDLGPLGDLAELHEAVDDGPASGTHQFVWAMNKASEAAGVRVVLDGIDGDVVVAHGQNRLHELARAGDWETFFREADLLVERHRERADWLELFEKNFGRDRAHVFSIYGVPALDALAESGSPWAFARSLREAVRHGGVYAKVVLDRVWRRLLVPGPILRRLRRPPLPTPRNVRAEQLDMMRATKLGRGVTLTTHMAAVFGLEAAHPFLDVRLVEFCLSLPSSQSLQDGWTRYVLRSALRSELPPAVRDRVGKANMSPAYHKGFFVSDRDTVDRLLRRAVELDGASGADLHRTRNRLEAAYAAGEPVEGTDMATLGYKLSAIAWRDVRDHRTPPDP